jgi:hypothetical protein
MSRCSAWCQDAVLRRLHPAEFVDVAEKKVLAGHAVLFTLQVAGANGTWTTVVSQANAMSVPLGPLAKLMVNCSRLGPV